MKTLEGKTVVIIGASGGIGRVLAHRFSEAGASVVLSARTEEKLRKIAGAMLAERVLVFPADASNPRDIEKLLAATREKFGTVDAVIIAAGTWKQLTRDAHVDDALLLATSHFQSLFLPTFVSGFVAQQYMRRERHGLIVNISSHAAVRPELLGNLTYSSMKAAARQFCHALRHELKGTEVRVTDLMPAIVNTKEAASLLDTEEKRRGAVQPEDIADWIIGHFDDPDIPAEKLFDSSVVL